MTNATEDENREPTMEEILASIRRIISDDEERAAAKGTTKRRKKNSSMAGMTFLN